MKSIKTSSMVVVIALLLLPQIASALDIEAALGVWRQNPSGNIAYKGISLDVDNDLNLGGSTEVFGRLKIGTPLFLPNVYFMATPMDFNGTGSKNMNFVFGNQTFKAGVPLTSKLQLDHYDLALYYGLPFVKTATLGILNVDAGIDVRLIDFEASIAQSAFGLNESKGLILAVPMVYVAAQVHPVKKFSLETEIRGIAYSSDLYFDVIGRVRYKVFGPAFISAGYRYENIKINDNQVKGNVNIGGPFAEVGVEF